MRHNGNLSTKVRGLHTLLAFVNRYNRTARPFNWKFTADDLTALLRRTSQREQSAGGQQAALPRAA